MVACVICAANIRAELYLGNPKNNLGNQLKYADNAPLSSRAATRRRAS